MNFKTTVCATLAMIVPLLSPLAQNRGQDPDNQQPRPRSGPLPPENGPFGPQNRRGPDRRGFGGPMQEIPRQDAGPQPGQALFNLLDTNHDGVLDKREIRAATTILRKLDIDRDGVVERREIAFMASMRNRPRNQGITTRRNEPDRFDNRGGQPRRDEVPHDNGAFRPNPNPRWQEFGNPDRQDRQWNQNQNRDQDQNRSQNQGRNERPYQGDNGGRNQGPRNEPQRDAYPGGQDRRQNWNPGQNPNEDPNQEEGQRQHQGRNDRRNRGDNGGRNEAPPEQPQKEAERKAE